MSTYLKYLPSNPLVVEGYAPGTTVAERFRLSRMRAGIVREYIVGKYDVPPQNAGFIGLGDQALDSPNKGRWDGVSLTFFLDRAELAARQCGARVSDGTSFWKSYTAGPSEGRTCERVSSDGGRSNGRRGGRRGRRLTSSLPNAGKQMRDRLEPAVDDLRREFARFQKTIEKLGEMANDGIRAVNEFNAARAQSSFSGSGTSH